MDKSPNDEHLFISLENVSLRHHGRIVFPNTNLKIYGNQHWAIIGANGSGKSALAKAICGRIPLADGKVTWRWHVAQPISNYNVALNIAPYEELTATYHSLGGQRVPVSFWVLPEDREKGEAFLPTILGDLRSLEEICGPYPFRAEKHGVVQTPHLGMEHQTVIAYGNAFREGDPPGYDWLHHHELSHEWWGNLVTCRDWKDMWIHEGIGTYMQALYLESRKGRGAYRAFMARNSRHLNRRAVASRSSS